MWQNVDALNNSEGNIFQKYLIPPDSKWTRVVMQKAGDYATKGNFVTSRVVCVSLTICAIAFSFFNMISYFLEAPIKILLNVVRFNPVDLVTDFIGDLVSIIRSWTFVGLGVTFVVAGLLFPQEIFAKFAPEYEISMQDQLVLYAERLEEAYGKKKEQEELASKDVSVATEHLQKLIEEKEELLSEIGKLKTQIREMEEQRSSWNLLKRFS